MRLAWADAIRAVAILFVVFIHSTNTASPFVINILTRTGVPLFIMVSGALLLEKTESLKEFFHKRVRKVLIPWILWTLIYVIYMIILGKVYPASISELKYLFETVFLSTYWYLPMIFSLYLFMPLFRLAVSQFKEIHYLYLFALWFIFVSVLPFFHSSPAFPGLYQPGLLITAVNFSGYLFLGLYLSRLHYSQRHFYYSISGLIFGQVISFIHPTQSLEYISPGVIISAVGLYILIITLFKHVWPKFNHRYLTAIGQASFGIFLIHPFISSVLNLSLGIPSALIIFFISLFAVLLLSRIPAGKYLVP